MDNNNKNEQLLSTRSVLSPVLKSSSALLIKSSKVSNIIIPILQMRKPEHTALSLFETQLLLL